MKSPLRLAIPLAFAVLGGCLANVPAKEDSCSLNIRWLEDFESAQKAAAETGRPILAVLVAGALRDHC